MKKKESAPIIVNDKKKEILYQSIKLVLLCAALIIMLMPTVSIGAGAASIEEFPWEALLIETADSDKLEAWDAGGEMNILECGAEMFEMLDVVESVTEEGIGRIFVNIFFVLSGISLYIAFIGVLGSIVLSVVTIIMYALGKGAQIEQVKGGTKQKGWSCGLFSMYGTLLSVQIVAMGTLFIATMGAGFGTVFGLLYRFFFTDGFHLLIPTAIITLINVVAYILLKPKK